jgi:hypothetical protein
VLLGRPTTHVGANLGEQTQGAVGADRVDLSEIDTRQLVKRAANVEARRIVAGLFPRPRAGALAASVEMRASIAASHAAS